MVMKLSGQLILAVILGKIYCKPSSWRTASSAVATDWVSKVQQFQIQILTREALTLEDGEAPQLMNLHGIFATQFRAFVELFAAGNFRGR